MNPYLAFVILFGVALAQSTILPRVTIIGVHPELMLMVMTSWSILRGAEEGMLWALIGGVLVDLLSGAGFGVHTLALLLIGFLSGLGERTLFRSEILMPLIIIPAATLVYELVLMGELYLTGWPMALEEHLTRIVFPSMLVNTLCMPVVYLTMRMLSRRIAREEVVL